MEHEVIKKNPNMKLEEDMRWIDRNLGMHSLLSSLYANASSKAMKEINEELPNRASEFMSNFYDSIDIEKVARRKVEELNIPHVSFTQYGDTAADGYTPGVYLDLILYYTLQSISELAKQEGISLSDDYGEKPVEDLYYELEEHLQEKEIPDKIEEILFEQVETQFRDATRLEKDMRWINSVRNSDVPIEVDSKFYTVYPSNILEGIHKNVLKKMYGLDYSDNSDEINSMLPDVYDFAISNIILYNTVKTITNIAHRQGIPVENDAGTEQRPAAVIFKELKEMMKSNHLRIDDVLKDLLPEESVIEGEGKTALTDVSSDDRVRSEGIKGATSVVVTSMSPEPEKTEEGKIEK